MVLIFHTKCRNLNITLLIFADDLFVLCGVDIVSFRLIVDSLSNFYHFSGLQPNMPKGIIFFAGVEAAYKEALRLVLPIPEGSLPAKYLGVPLISTRLRAHDCAQMKEKTLHSGANVAWHAVCAPKEEGGLGLCVLKTWNKACMMRHQWAICMKADTLWIKWIHTFILRNQSVWRVKIPQEASWTIRKLFQLRDEIQPWIKYIIGDGKSTYLWVDNWHNLGPICKRFGDSGDFHVGRPLFAKVSSIIHNGAWQWPRPRSAITKEIVSNFDPSLIPNVSVPDCVRWTLCKYGFSHHVPRWAFIEWLALLGRLSTKDRLYSWGVVSDQRCVLCQVENESHEHLFFACAYSSAMWDSLLQRNNIFR
ncbi:hypothetical protein RHMOL_Rhmol02G0164200 [Rhododendron molle]|uniref:Uncharacterized protein n=1 Tax=Rhododendron molle TaxID=49168 RepID=A0ACC0PSG1_RHOML|nr:hypothetical protein RHMOL_Rhmol02G0164200 [Rhododendron molle]